MRCGELIGHHTAHGVPHDDRGNDTESVHHLQYVIAEVVDSSYESAQSLCP